MIVSKHNGCPFAEKQMTILNYKPGEFRHRQTSPAIPGCGIEPATKREGGEWFGWVSE
jgi:hypothetical protein